MTETSPFEAGLERGPANFQPLTPLGFLERAASVYPERTAVVYGARHTSYRDFYRRCRRLAASLAGRGIGTGAVVAVMAPNVPALLEAHFGVPMAGAVLNPLNVRLDAPAIAEILEHGDARAVICDRAYGAVMAEALGRLGRAVPVIAIDDDDGPGGELPNTTPYEAFLEEGEPDFQWSRPDDEWQAISLNYTSGTTGEPKGVVYHHRGAYLNAIGNALAWHLPAHPIYLWTLPMFHCNGWCFPWTVTALAGTHVCLRRVEPDAIFAAIEAHEVTHFCGAPVVLNLLANAPAEARRALGRTVEVMTTASAPPAAVIAAVEAMGFRITHVYGLTEVYGPAVVCAWPPEWDALEPDRRAALKARQGVRYPVLDGLMVAEPETMNPVPSDGRTVGEIMMRGNIVMKGYLKDRAATEKSFAHGWFHSGDLGVMHDDGYIELKDRSKDIIISGGENISTIEVESVLYRHPDILEAAVVAKPDEKWGEVGCAFVTLKPNAQNASRESIIAFCRDNLAHFKAPHHVVFTELPKTATGKVQKFALRERARRL